MIDFDEDYQRWQSTRRVEVPGGAVECYLFNDDLSLPTVIVVNGGPGLPCDYIREPHSFLSRSGIRLIAYDQLGTGSSTQTDDETLFTIERYTEELDSVRQAMVGDAPVHLIGQSWGGWLCVEYTTTYPERVSSLVLENTSADIPFLRGELDRLKRKLGDEIYDMMRFYEARRDYEHPEYAAALTLLEHRHVLRLREKPKCLERSLGSFAKEIYQFMQGPNEFLFTGNLREWSRLSDLHKIKCPTKIMCGRYDEMTPENAYQMHREIEDSDIYVFENSSHSPFFEEPEKFRSELLGFYEKIL